MKTSIYAALLSAALCAPAFGADNQLTSAHTHPALGAPEDPKVPIAWNRFYDAEGLTRLMRQLHVAYPELTEMVMIGKSFEGREIWAIEITNPEAGPKLSKPAMYIDGNIHGNEVQASETVLYTAWYLLEMYGKVEGATKLVDERVFYLVPTINPDGRDWWFESANNPHSNRGGRMPIDSDGDGAFDEDGPEDLNGDGQITQMRIKDPYGQWKLDPDFPEQLMVRVEPEERGEYTLLWSEGIDNDGDGEINEDGPGGYDPNRNWAWDWQPEGVQFGAHNYPFSLPETKAVRDYVLARPNIAGVQSYHNNGGMILRGPGREGGQMTPDDERVMAQIARRGEQMLPGYRSMVVWKDLYTVWGGETEWFYSGLGITSYTNELWTDDHLYHRELAGGQEGRKERARWVKYLLLNQGLTKWEEVDHPTFGKVEVGGLAKNWGRVPPSFMLEEELHRNAMFTFHHADSLPLVRPAETIVESMEGGLWRIRHSIDNRGLVPTRLEVDTQSDISPENTVTISGGVGLKVAASGIVEDINFDRVKWQKLRPEVLRVKRVGGNDRLVVEFIVEGSGTVQLEVVTQRGGTYKLDIPLEETPKNPK